MFPQLLSLRCITDYSVWKVSNSLQITVKLVQDACKKVEEFEKIGSYYKLLS